MDERNNLSNINYNLVKESVPELTFDTSGDELWTTLFNNYSISSYGRIRNERTGRILKEYKDSNGHPRVRVQLNGHNVSIIREVYKHFVDSNLKDTDTVYRINPDKPASVDNITIYDAPRSDKYNVGDIIHDHYTIIAYEKMIQSCQIQYVYVLKCNICKCICLCNLANIDVATKHRCLCNVKKKSFLV